MNTMNITITSEYGKIPAKGSLKAAGYDLYSCENGIIQPHSISIINTGIKIEIPDGLYGRIAPRSGLAVKHGIDVFAGVIDSDYRGEIKCVLYNSSENPFNFNIGDKIAQIIFEKYYDFDFNVTNELSITKRNTNGFGSTS